jgi:putative ABC transport system ATP-binding protein
MKTTNKDNMSPQSGFTTLNIVPSEPSGTEHPVIEVENLWRIYKTGSQDILALRGLDLHVKAGQFVALKGRSGSGKTTLLNCLGGLDQPTTGTVRVLGKDLSQMDDRQLTRWRREQVGLVFQSFGLLPTLSAYENVELMLRIKGASSKERRHRTLECLELVHLGKWIYHRPYEMSGGQQQRVAIARALANQPQIILADEPTGELDSATAREILALFRLLVELQHITLLMVSHDPLVDEYANQIFQLKDGQISNTNHKLQP